MLSHAIKVKENGHSKNAFSWCYTLFLLIIIRFKTILRNISSNICLGDGSLFIDHLLVTSAISVPKTNWVRSTEIQHQEASDMNHLPKIVQPVLDVAQFCAFSDRIQFSQTDTVYFRISILRVAENAPALIVYR